jgi:outer membrane protein OmpA-like peptidoglycan-associated protein
MSEIMNKKVLKSSVLSLVLSTVVVSCVSAQEFYPQDTGLADYHRGPDYRQSESHPLRIVGYALHPVGWVFREVIFRPFSWLASSTEETRSVMGYRDPRDFRGSECFPTNDEAPDCHSIPPFNYGSQPDRHAATHKSREVFFPEVNFEFNKSSLNDLGRGRIHQLAALLQANEGARIVLEGHADVKGGDDYNQKLGLSRAETVKQELALLGVSGDRMSTVTFGKAKPELAGDEDWARAVNRRVEVRVN